MGNFLSVNKILNNIFNIITCIFSIVVGFNIGKIVCLLLEKIGIVDILFTFINYFDFLVIF